MENPKSVVANGVKGLHIKVNGYVKILDSDGERGIYMTFV